MAGRAHSTGVAHELILRVDAGGSPEDPGQPSAAPTMSLHFAPGEQEARGDDAPGNPGASRGSRSQRSATAYRTWEVVPDWQADAAALRLATARSESGVATTTSPGSLPAVR